MNKSVSALAFMAFLLFGFAEAHAGCDPLRDPGCVSGGGGPGGVIIAPAPSSPPSDSAGGSGGSGGVIIAPPPPPGDSAGGTGRSGGAGGVGRARYGGGRTGHYSGRIAAGGAGTTPLQPVRAYLRAKDIPPAGAGAYGLVVFHSRATAASRAKFMMVCNSFVAFFPRSETSSVPIEDQMITVWPLDNPNAKQAKKDDCAYVLDHYELVASEAAIRDAQKQHAKFEGEGPYLVGWSPSKARNIPDALVLVVDMSADNTQADIDNKFRFWKNKIVEDPSLWRNGWSVEQLRSAIHNFADQYGQAMLDAVKLWGEKKP